MQVQKIQSANNYKNPTFHATFVNDSKGYFRRIWQAAEKNEALTKRIGDFKSVYPEHKLEITEYNLTNGYCEYVVFNHKTGKTDHIEMGKAISSPGAFEYLLYYLSCGHIFREDDESKLYREITGIKG